MCKPPKGTGKAASVCKDIGTFECIRVLSIFIAIIPSHLLCQINGNSPGVESLRTMSKCTKRKNFDFTCSLHP